MVERSADDPVPPDLIRPAGTDRLDVNRLSTWMRDHVKGFAGPVSYSKFSGGQSNPTYRLDVPGGSYVLRRKPFGPVLPSAHAVDREFRVTTALHRAGFPVPRPHALCEDETVIGSAFYVMEMVEGRSLSDGTMPGVAPVERAAHYHAMVDTLAALHGVDHHAAGLAGYGRPGNYFGRQVARWTRQYQAAETEHIPAVERLIEWLPRTVPDQTGVSVVHGDYRIDNLIFAPGAPHVAAVLDWELSTIGDPLADLSYFLMSWVTPPAGHSGVMGATGPENGTPTMAETVGRYCAATGREDLPNLQWHFAYNLFRLTAITQGIKKRVELGTASSNQAHETAARVGALADTAWEFARDAGA